MTFPAFRANARVQQSLRVQSIVPCAEALDFSLPNTAIPDQSQSRFAQKCGADIRFVYVRCMVQYGFHSFTHDFGKCICLFGLNQAAIHRNDIMAADTVESCHNTAFCSSDRILCLVAVAVNAI